MAERLRTLTEHVVIPDDVICCWSWLWACLDTRSPVGILVVGSWLDMSEIYCWTCLNTRWRPWLKVGLCLVFAQSVWGSFWNAGRWGYQCCHSFIKESYCTGQAGKEAHQVGTCFFVCAFILCMLHCLFFVLCFCALWLSHVDLKYMACFFLVFLFSFPIFFLPFFLSIVLFCVVEHMLVSVCVCVCVCVCVTTT